MNVVQKYGTWVLLLFHVIGFTLFLIDPNFAKLSYLTLILSGVVLFLAEIKGRLVFVPFVLIFAFGFYIELFGTSTGILFGEYWYGDSLGMKNQGVPIVIGVNWYVIVVASGSIAKRIVTTKYLQILIAALLCVFMDFLIEPVAMKYDFWDWVNGEIPLSNYIWWFVFSLLFTTIYLQISSTRNRPAEWLWVIWVPFFLLLNWL